MLPPPPPQVTIMLMRNVNDLLVFQNPEASGLQSDLMNSVRLGQVSAAWGTAGPQRF